ncbi:hypothetical protein T281_14980 [Rhodomicrobium udaipurense JA643]|uniref:Uncharacterized protein n=1 Tax=Rhodomicrobium udaipurense TaxID=1202716 RepID=A0A8I1GEJ6_9HYPH|nr:hypothetical protein [Rhodomicrobium udaipurense]KAI93724.1 hypothetical protein T281_14980 [Rhodomicrobium udaipurense JA643]MBJ7542341.1 hypothetical protein [Rhodomicrobium udaipurense]
MTTLTVNITGKPERGVEGARRKAASQFDKAFQAARVAPGSPVTIIDGKQVDGAVLRADVMSHYQRLFGSDDEGTGQENAKRALNRACGPKGAYRKGSDAAGGEWVWRVTNADVPPPGFPHPIRLPQLLN